MDGKEGGQGESETYQKYQLTRDDLITDIFNERAHRTIGCQCCITFSSFFSQRLWSTKSDVWSFGVLMWEMFSFCQDVPLAELNHHQIIENLQHWFHSDGFHLIPSRPSAGTPKEVTDLMHQCWSREPEDRPKFGEIYQFLQNKCIGYSVD